MKMMRSLLLMLVLLSYVMIPTGCDNNDEEPHNGAYSIRDIGPAGGLIFYINPNYKTDGWRYMEAAPTDETPKEWGAFEIDVPGADGTAIGTGAQNTIEIINSDPSDNTAAYACANFSIVKDGVTYDDWFLPSRDELEKMFINLQQKGVGNFSTNSMDYYATYWSSSEGGVKLSWGKCFETAEQKAGTKKFPLSIRPVRVFQEPGL
jgi:hypothetical protein